MTTWFTSDTHYYHKNIIKYCNRPFQSVEDMNSEMITRFNERVAPHDDVWHLGDFGFGGNRPDQIARIFERLNGHLRLIIGNHDDENTISLPWAEKPVPLAELVVDGQRIVACHYAMRTWPKIRKGAWNLFGHSHGNMKGFGNCIDVGVDAGWQFAPVTTGEIRQRMKNLPLFDGEGEYDARSTDTPASGFGL